MDSPDASQAHVDEQLARLFQADARSRLSNAIGTIVALVLISAGLLWTYSESQSAIRSANYLKNEVSTTREELTKAKDELSRHVTSLAELGNAVTKQDALLKKQLAATQLAIERFQTKVATDRWERSREEFTVKRGEAVPIDFENAHEGQSLGVRGGNNWTFVAKENGPYTINVSVGGYGKPGDLVGLTLSINQSHPIYLLQTSYPTADRWCTLFGTASITLKKNDQFQVRVYADGGNKAAASQFGGAGLTWITVTH